MKDLFGALADGRIERMFEVCGGEGVGGAVPGPAPARRPPWCGGRAAVVLRDEYRVGGLQWRRAWWDVGVPDPFDRDDPLGPCFEPDDPDEPVRRPDWPEDRDDPGCPWAPPRSADHGVPDWVREVQDPACRVVFDADQLTDPLMGVLAAEVIGTAPEVDVAGVGVPRADEAGAAVSGADEAGAVPAGASASAGGVGVPGVGVSGVGWAGSVTADDRLLVLLAGAPGPRLAAVLARSDFVGASAGVLVEASAAVARQVAYDQALQVRLAGLLDACPRMNPSWPAHVTATRPGVAADELSMRLCVSTRTAQRWITQSRLFSTCLTGTGDALAEGRIDTARATGACQLLCVSVLVSGSGRG